MQSQIFRDNYPSDDPEHFILDAIFVPYLDHLIVEMEDRFFDQKQKCRSLWGLIPKYSDAFAKDCCRKVIGNISGRVHFACLRCEKSAVDNISLKTISRDTEHVTNFHKQRQNFAENCHTTSHLTVL